jgi:hypothetical protein
MPSGGVDLYLFGGTDFAMSAFSLGPYNSLSSLIFEGKLSIKPTEQRQKRIGALVKSLLGSLGFLCYRQSLQRLPLLPAVGSEFAILCLLSTIHVSYQTVFIKLKHCILLLSNQRACCF